MVISQEIVMKQALEALDWFIGEMTVGQRYTNEGQQALDATWALRQALDDELCNELVVDVSQPKHEERNIVSRSADDKHIGLSSKQYMLEMAAKAEGHGVEFTIDGAGDWHCWYENRFTCIPWNPLVYKADAMELAVKLELEITYGTDPLNQKVVRVRHADEDSGWFEAEAQCGDDACAATCLAIVCAAVEIGRNMK